MKNILLTGSGGFIGSHLKHHLREYHLFTPRSFQLNLLDKTETSHYLQKNHIDFIIHSASCGVRIRPDATLEEVATPNMEMFHNLADSQIPMITIGSGAEYDKSRPLVRIKEEDFGKSIPQDPYGYSKYLISKEVRFNFIWIDDFCKIVKHFVQQSTREKFINVAPTQSIEIVELAKIAGVKTIVKNPGLNKEYTADNSKLLAELQGFNFTSYQEGLDKFYRQQIKAS